ncbi:hypothetical protein AQUCO_02300113v1 [Aquilegia coerulea]|uniref:Uncharacterized protein n=1 Tax=Aquilegia coerulea TaxID=218851 RepID=A0A2G5DC51_AQUCA|nr:hypothetical protein AQUCO_02300113v1 [Aquilegia coerulea]
MANHPPINTLKQDLFRGAFPNTALNPPNTIKAKLAAPATTPNLTLCSLINAADSKGTIAPIENARADAKAACNGFGRPSLSVSTFKPSPIAILHAPATKPAKPASIMGLTSSFTAPIPIIKDAVETKPSVAPRTAALSHCALWE